MGFSLSRSARAAALAGCAMALGGCPDRAHFDAQAYEIVYTNPMFDSLGGGTALRNPANYLGQYAGYAPPLCPSGTTTASAGAQTVDVDWHGCVGGPATDYVGSFAYVGGGVYEGLIDVTSTISASPPAAATYTVLLRLEPRRY